MKVSKNYVYFDRAVDLFSALDDLSMLYPTLIIQTTLIFIGSILPPTQKTLKKYPKEYFDFIGRDFKPMDPLQYPKRDYTVAWSEDGFKANQKIIMKKVRNKLQQFLPYTKVGSLVALEKQYLEIVKEHYNLVRQGKAVNGNKARRKYRLSSTF